MSDCSCGRSESISPRVKDKQNPITINKFVNCIHLTPLGRLITVCAVCRQSVSGDRGREFIYHLHEIHSLPVSRMNFGFYLGIAFLILSSGAFYVRISMSEYMVGFVDNENDLNHLPDIIIGNDKSNTVTNIEENGKFISELLMRENYSCSICEMNYDTVSEEILKSHIEQCMQNEVDRLMGKVDHNTKN